MFESLAIAVNNFKKTGLFTTHFKLGPEKADVLEEALNFAYTEYSPKKISQRISEKKLSFVEGGFKKHGIGISFYGNYMAVGDRGVESDDHTTLEVYKIDPALVTSKIIDEIQSTQKKLELEEGLEYFFKSLPTKLSPTGKIEKDALCSAFASIAPGYQKGGHCGLKGKQSVLRFAWAMLLSDAPDEETLRQARLEHKIFTNFSAISSSNTALQTYKELAIEDQFMLQIGPAWTRALNRKFDRLKWNRWQAGYWKASWKDWPKFLFRKYVTAT